MDRQQKIDILQKELSRKDLAFGCMIEYIEVDNSIREICRFVSNTEVGEAKIMSFNNEEWSILDGQEGLDYINLGHPVILSDVLVWFGKQGIGYLLGDVIGFTVFQNPLAKEWGREINRDLTKPYLSEQDDTVVDGIYEVFLLTKKD